MDPLPIWTSAAADDLRDLDRVMESGRGEPVAIVRNGHVVAYLVPPEQMKMVGHLHATREEVERHLREGRERNQPVLDWLRDK